jgi:serine protease Do
MRLLDRLAILAMMLWLGSMLLERAAVELVRPTPPLIDVPTEALPRVAPDPDDLPDLARGRVGMLQVEHPRRGGYHSGTAWQVGDGVWLSARHVVDFCDMRRLGPLDRPQLSRLWRHPDADLVAFATATAPRALALAETPPRAGQRGYAIGYPRGDAGLVELTLVGSARMQLTGAIRSDRPFRYHLWQIESLPGHVPDASGLGGISGGVVVDRSGRALGVAFSTIPRRALLGSVSYADTRAAVAATDARAREATLGAGAAADVRGLAGQLLQEGAVLPVLCGA